MEHSKTTLPKLEIFRTAHQALLRNWGRAVLTSLSMVVGAASIVLVVVIGISGRAFTLDIIRGVGTNLITIYHETDDDRVGGAALMDRLNNDDLKAIQMTPGVQNVAPLILSAPQISFGGVTKAVALIGATPEYLAVRNLQVLKGKFLDDNDLKFRSKVCLISELLAKKLDRDPFYKGDISFYGIRFRVVGVFRESVNALSQTEVTDFSALIPLSVIRYFKPAETIDQIYVSAQSMEIVPQVSAAIEKLLISRHRKHSHYKVENMAGMLAAANKIGKGLTIVLMVIAVISLIASGVGIMNVMLITVAERTREIGIKKAIGALRRMLLMEFLTEALILSGGGGLVGTALGAAAPYSIHFFAPGIQIRIPPLAIILGFGVTLLIGIVFGMIPAIRASRLDPVEALRYE
jgi:putative ABC transport system permease protein